MALQSLQSLLPWPIVWGFTTARYRVSLVDNDGEGLGLVFRAPVAGDITKIGFKTATVTTGDDMLCQIETVDLATGLPSGSLVNAGATATVTIADGDDTVWKQSGAFGTPATVTKGQLIAAVVKAGAGFGGNLNIVSADRMEEYGKLAFPYAVQNTGGWAALLVETVGIFAIVYDGDVYHEIPGAVPVKAWAPVLFNSTDTPDEVGNIFQVPMPCRVTGCWISCDYDLGDATVKLYDSDGSSVLADVTVDKDVRNNTGKSPEWHYFDESPELLKDTNYRITIVPGAADIALNGYEVDAAAMLDQKSGGSECHKTARTDGGGFTETTTQRMGIGVLIDQLDDGVGGGGVSIVNTRRNIMIGR